ncbi:hypothetical protein FRC00_014387, partial [Tulasnella sp. 408]
SRSSSATAPATTGPKSRKGSSVFSCAIAYHRLSHGFSKLDCGVVRPCKQSQMGERRIDSGTPSPCRLELEGRRRGIRKQDPRPGSRPSNGHGYSNHHEYSGKRRCRRAYPSICRGGVVSEGRL